MIAWINKPLVLAIHDRQIAEHGGSCGVRDDNLLESALAGPQQLHAYGNPSADLAELAATLAYGLVRNHPFIDGNKRTAAVICETFIELNDARLSADDLELFSHFIALANGTLDLDEFTRWLRAHIRCNTNLQVQEPNAIYET